MPAKKSDEKTKNVTVTLSESDNNYCIAESGKSVNRGIICALKMLRHMETEGLKQINNKLTAPEWRYVAIALRNEPLEMEERTNTNLLADAVLNAKNNDVLADMYKVDVHELYTKLTMFNTIQTFALVNRCRKFWLEHSSWESGDSFDDKKMTNFCNQLAKQ